MSTLPVASTKREVLGIDLLRFLSAIFVLTFHLCFWNFWAEDQVLYRALGSASIAEAFGKYINFGWVGVEVFFVISGFIIAYTAEGATPFSFFRSRFLRLMPGVWICCIASLPMVYWIKHQPSATVAKLFLKSMVLYPVGPWIEGVLWTLVVEVAFYGLVFFLIWRKAFRHIDLVAAVVGLYSALYWIAREILLAIPRFQSFAHHMSDISWGPYVQLSLVHYGCFFSLGVAIWLALIKRQSGLLRYLGAPTVLGCCFEIAYVNSTKVQATSVSQPALIPFLAWLSCVLLLMLAVHQRARFDQICTKHALSAPARIKWLGRMTYPLYLLHLPVGLTTIYFSPSFLNQYARWFLGVAAALAVSAFVTSYAEPWIKRRAGFALDWASRLL